MKQKNLKHEPKFTLVNTYKKYIYGGFKKSKSYLEQKSPKIRTELT